MGELIAVHGNFKHNELEHGEKYITTHIPEIDPKPEPNQKPLNFWYSSIRLIAALFRVLFYWIKEEVFNIKPKSK